MHEYDHFLEKNWYTKILLLAFWIKINFIVRRLRRLPRHSDKYSLVLSTKKFYKIRLPLQRHCKHNTNFSWSIIIIIRVIIKSFLPVEIMKYEKIGVKKRQTSTRFIREFIKDLLSKYTSIYYSRTHGFL